MPFNSYRYGRASYWKHGEVRRQKEGTPRPSRQREESEWRAEWRPLASELCNVRTR
jgi:hypothetical protein